MLITALVNAIFIISDGTEITATDLAVKFTVNCIFAIMTTLGMCKSCLPILNYFSIVVNYRLALYW